MTKHWLFWTILAVTVLLFLYSISAILAPFILGILVAYFLDPAADKLQSWRLSRTLATALITVGFFLAIGLLALLVIPSLAAQLSELFAALPGYVTSINDNYLPRVSDWLGGLPPEHLANLKAAGSNVSGAVLGAGGNVLSGIFQSGLVLMHIVSLALITPVVTFYLLRDWDALIARMDNLLPRDTAPTIRTQCRIIDRTLSGFIRGQLNVCMILAAYYAVGLTLAGLNFSIAIGILTGFLVIIPYIGIMLGTLIGVAIAFFQFGDLASVAIVLAIFVSGQAIEGTFITPKLVGDKVGLHPLWIIFGMLAGGTLLGFVGILIAIPLTAIIGVLIRFGVQEYLQSDYYKGDRKTPAKR